MQLICKMLSSENQQMLKSWVKVFVATIATLVLSGYTGIIQLLFAGLSSIIPLAITWLDPNDSRFGTVKKVAKQSPKKKK